MSANFRRAASLGKDLRNTSRTSRKAVADFSRRSAMPESDTQPPDRLMAGTRVTPAPAPTKARMVAKLVCCVLTFAPFGSTFEQNDST